MRIFLSFFFLALVFGNGLKAQTKVYASLAFNQSFVQVDSLNWVIDRYNDTHTSDKDLGNIHSPRGISASLGLVFNRLLVDLSFTQRMQTRKAKDPELSDGSHSERHLRFSANTFDIGFGVKIAGDDYHLLAIGASVDFGAVKVFTRSGNSGQSNNQAFRYPIVNELNFGNTIFLHGFIPFGGSSNPIRIFLRPYFQWAWVKNDYYRVNQNLNPQSYQSDPFYILAPAYNFGIKIGLAFYGG